MEEIKFDLLDAFDRGTSHKNRGLVFEDNAAC
jgi:hypothetical protein